MANDSTRPVTLLPSIPGHRHVIDADGHPTCGCVSPDWAHCAEHSTMVRGCTACWGAILRHGQLTPHPPTSARLDMRTLYDEFDDLQTRPACPECHRRTRDALQLGAIFAGIMLVLGGLIGWFLHAVIMHGGGQ